MRISSASTLVIFFLIEILLFSILWLSIPIMNIIGLIAHGLITLLASYWFSRKWRQTSISPNKFWFMLAVFLLFLPVVGVIILFLFNKKVHMPQAMSEERENKKQIDVNDDLNYFSTPKHNYSSSVKNPRNLLSTLDDTTYLHLLIASRHLPDKEAYTLLKEALSSPFESARLMAFSLKDKLEERLQNDLQQKLILLKNSPQQHTAELHLSITKDYIHLVNTGILSESKETLLKKALQHCMNAIHLNNKSSYAFDSLGEILKYQEKYTQAQQARTRATYLRTPSVKTLN